MAIEQGEALVRLGAFIGGGVAIGVSAAGASIGDGLAGSQLLAGVARQPEAQQRLMTPFLMVVSFAESNFFISLGFALLLFYVTPGL
ncbi:MAG TPA: ATP F0F1 synthase subunit C [Actinophytocola sp.]|uniref:ATP F0F1 synthase subunit C n=1 Tax=Actinophytocola sp. TaxID=1872138 RepID=UPI002DBC01F6|nr:ATP F0F1 synthase subunit C [Actinophytocola sp.]HEU5470860.1 ATP F0F1 synthase subunit C [Actinophytocola sp.]